MACLALYALSYVSLYSWSISLGVVSCFARSPGTVFALSDQLILCMDLSVLLALDCFVFFQDLDYSVGFLCFPACMIVNSGLSFTNHQSLPGAAMLFSLVLFNVVCIAMAIALFSTIVWDAKQ